MEHGVEYVYSVYRACVGEGKKPGQGAARRHCFGWMDEISPEFCKVFVLFCFALLC